MLSIDCHLPDQQRVNSELYTINKFNDNDNDYDISKYYYCVIYTGDLSSQCSHAADPQASLEECTLPTGISQQCPSCKRPKVGIIMICDMGHLGSS